MNILKIAFISVCLLAVGTASFAQEKKEGNKGYIYGKAKEETPAVKEDVPQETIHPFKAIKRMDDWIRTNLW